MPVAAQERQQEPSGQQYYLTYCGSCHGTTGEGNGPMAEDLRVAPADLTRISERHGGTFPEAQLSEVIDGRRRVRAHGSKDMPVWGRVFAQDPAAGSSTETAVRAKVRPLVEYLKSIQKGK
jgi:mono/diheme cytochrome c family protein